MQKWIARGLMSALMLGTGATRVLAEDAPADAPTEAFTFNANVGVFSDYRFRGVSLSDRDVVLQGGFGVSHESGAYLGIWSSTIQEVNGAEAEIDLFGGFKHDLGPVSLDVGATGYVYPGGSAINYYELYIKGSHNFGPLGATLSFYYAPDQKNLSERNYYINAAGSFAIPDTPFALSASVGYERGAFDYSQSETDPRDNGKIDWSAGVSATWKQFTASVSYVDSNRELNIGHAGVVASLVAAF